MDECICEKCIYDICRKPNPSARFKRLVDQNPWLSRICPRSNIKTQVMCE